MNNPAESNTSKALKGMSSQTLVTFLAAFVEIASFSIMSRLLTKEDFGYYAAVTAIVAIFKSLSETGIGSAIIQRKNPDSRYINNAFTVSLCFGIFLMALLCILAHPIAVMVVDETMTVPLIIMSVTLLCQCLKSVNQSLIIRRLEFLKAGTINLVAETVTVIVAIILAANGFGYYASITKVVLSSVLSLIISYFFINTKLALQFDIKTFKTIFNFSGWLMFSAVIRNLSQQADKLLMSRLLSVKDLGAYNRPKDFVFNISSHACGIFDTALFPILSDLQDDKRGLINGYRKSLYLLNLLGILISLSFVVNSELIIRIFFGEQWMSLNMLTKILSLYVMLNANGRLTDCYIRSLGLTKQQFFFRCLQLALTFLGLFISYRRGTVGVGVSVIVVNLIMVIIKMIFISSKIDFTFQKAIEVVLDSWRFLLYALPIGIALIIFTPNTWIGHVVTAAIWGLTVAVIFLFFPKLQGSLYQKEFYARVISIIQEVLKRLHIVKQGNESV